MTLPDEEFDADALADELSEFAPAEKSEGPTPREERIMAGFEEIQNFVAIHGRRPENHDGRDIFERLYAVRLEQLQKSAECRALIAHVDHQRLLEGEAVALSEAAPELDDEALAAELRELADETAPLTELRHVRSVAQKRAACEVAQRQACADFAHFKPLFQQMQTELERGVRRTEGIRKAAGFRKTEIAAGRFFILDGLTAYVAAVGTPIKAPNGENDARLRVIFSNGTESDLLLRSLQRALYDDEHSRLVSEPDLGPLFGGVAEPEDQASGTIYVARSCSTDPFIAANRALIHKIGVTGGDVQKRLANAARDPTFLLADVELVATYELFNIDRTKLENLIHRVFAGARLEVAIQDRFGQPVTPREWFLVPLEVIDEAVARIQDGTIEAYRYDPAAAALVWASAPS